MADAPKNQKAGFEIWIDFFLKNDLKQKETADLYVFTEFLRHCLWDDAIQFGLQLCTTESLRK